MLNKHATIDIVIFLFSIAMLKHVWKLFLRQQCCVRDLKIGINN